MTTSRISEDNLIPLIKSYNILLPTTELRKLVKSIFGDVQIR